MTYEPEIVFVDAVRTNDIISGFYLSLSSCLALTRLFDLPMPQLPVINHLIVL